MWIAGLARPAEAAPAPAHAVQPRPPVGRDRHGLHEPEPVGARRPGVRLHRDADAAAAQDRRRPLDGEPQVQRADRRLDARGLRLARGAVASRSRASATTCARSRSPRATRSRPRSGSASRSTATASASSSTAVRRRRRRERRRGWSPSTRTPTSSRPTLRAGGERRESLRDAARIEAGLRGFLDGRRLQGLHRHLRGPRRAARSCPGIAVQRLMADGYGFGAEGDWKTAALVRIIEGDGRRASRAARRSWRTTPTTSRRASRRCSARTCSRCARRSRRAAVAARSTRSRSAAARTRCGSSSPPRPGRRSSSGLLDLGDRFRLVANEVEVVDARARSCRACRSRGRSGSRSPTSPPRPRPGSIAGGPHHTVLHDARRRSRRCHDFARDRRASSSLVIDERTDRLATSRRSCAGTRPTTTSPAGSSADGRARRAAGAGPRGEPRDRPRRARRPHVRQRQRRRPRARA